MKNRLNYSLLLALALTAVLVGCKKHHDDQPKPAIPPTINDFSPRQGLPGTTVKIIGTGFSTTPADNIVTLGNAQATVSASTDTTITITIPAGAVSNRISVSVNNLSATSVLYFELLVDIPRNGLAAFYRFAGNTNDESGNNNNATLGNHADGNGPDLANDRYGRAASAYTFDGDGDYIKIANSPSLQINDNITISFWLSLTQITNPYIISKQIAGCKGYQISLGKDGSDDSKENIFISFDAASEYFSNTSFSGTSQWFFIAIVKNGTLGTTTTYVDNNDPKQNNNIPALTDCATDIILGTYPDFTNVNAGAGGLHGSMDDIAIYNRALDANEIATLYRQTITRY